jgi:hypothetical protein
MHVYSATLSHNPYTEFIRQDERKGDGSARKARKYLKKLNATFWSNVGTVKFNRLYMGWLAKLEEEGLSMKAANEKRLFTGNGPGKIVEQNRKETSQVSVLSLEAFFIHGDWMRDWKHEIREWFTVHYERSVLSPPAAG